MRKEHLFEVLYALCEIAMHVILFVCDCGRGLVVKEGGFGFFRGVRRCGGVLRSLW